MAHTQETGVVGTATRENSFDRSLRGSRAFEDMAVEGADPLNLFNSDFFRMIGPPSDSFAPLYRSGCIALAARLLCQQASFLIDHFGRCESPIERLFLLALLVNCGFDQTSPVHFLQWATDVDGNKVGEAPMVLGDHVIVSTPNRLLIGCQWGIDRFRVDFFLRYEIRNWVPNSCVRTAEVIIECDGHNYHERTKEQARCDKSRDRRLARLGFTVFRYTGSELFNDAFGCVEEILGFLSDKAVKAPRLEEDVK